MEIKIVGDSDEYNSTGTFAKELILSNDGLEDNGNIELFLESNGQGVTFDVTQLYVAVKALYEKSMLEEEIMINYKQTFN